MTLHRDFTKKLSPYEFSENRQPRKRRDTASLNDRKASPNNVIARYQRIHIGERYKCKPQKRTLLKFNYSWSYLLYEKFCFAVRSWGVGSSRGFFLQDFSRTPHLTKLHFLATSSVNDLLTSAYPMLSQSCY